MATREQLIEDFADHKYATGERFARLINSMKVVQEPVETPAASGTSLSFIDSIEQDKDGKITATKKTLDLANAHELNPFKGWYKTGDTLPTDGFDGAYLYFKDTSEQTGLTTIYRWNGTTYADTGTVVDTSNVQTFETGQAVNAVKIKDENGVEVQGTANVLSAEAGKIIGDKLVLGYQHISLNQSSTYFLQKINNIATNSNNNTFIVNQYTSSYSIYVFNLPAGSYMAKLIHESTTQVFVGTIESTEDIVNGGSIKSVIVDDHSVLDNEVEFSIDDTTLLFILGEISNINYYAYAEEIKEIGIKPTVIQLQGEFNDLNNIVSNLVVDNLNTDDSTKALSAKQGKIIGDGLKKKQIYISTPQKYEDDISEFYFISQDINNEPNVILKCYSNTVYTGFSDNSVLANYNITNAVNNVIYPITVYSSQNENYPVNSVFGYVIFKNIEHFRNTSTTEPVNFINKEFCSILSNQQIIDTYLQYIVSINSDITSIYSDISELEAIKDVIDKGFLKEYTIADFVSGYTSTDGKNIGDVITKVSTSYPYTSNSTAGQLVISVKAGDKVTLRFRDISNRYCRNWILTDSTYHILSWAANGTYNYINNVPLVLTAESDGYLFIQITKDYYQYNSVGLKIDTYMTIEESVSNIIEEAIEDLDIVEKVVVCVPDEINAVVGDTLQLYYRSIFRVVDYSKYDVNITCSVGAQYPRYYEITPIASQIGNYNIRFRIYDNNHKLLGEKSSTLKIKQKVNSPASELNVLCVGASATANGEWASEFKRRLVGIGGLPVGSEVSNVVFVGRMNRTVQGKQVNLEATGGYSFSSYNSTNTARYRFDVATFEGLLINVDDIYSNNGHNFTIKEINSTDNYFSCDGDGEPEPASTSNPKTLTKVSGTGSETISYISKSFHGNPFVYNGSIDIQQYADDYCNPQQSEHGRIDVVYTELFGNGTPAYGENMTTRMVSMQTFINNILAVFPNCKFCIGLFWNPDIRGGMGVNYGATGAWSDPYAIKYSNMNMCNELQEYINANNLGDKVYILNWLNEFDEENDMQQTAKALNTRYATLLTETNSASGMIDTSKIYLLKNFSNGLTPGVYCYLNNNKSLYSVSITKGTSQPSGAISLSVMSTIIDGVYEASNLSDFSTLPTNVGANNAKVYYYNDDETYTIWTIVMFKTGTWIPKEGYGEIFGVNGVHPSVVGYNQMADSAWRLFITKFCQGS